MAGKIVYIAGAYRSGTEWGLEKNIRRAEEAALMVWKSGDYAICPHKNTAHFGGALDIPDKVWLEGDLEILSRCDAIYMLDNWRDSIGAKFELAAATKLKLEIYYE